MTRYIDLDRYGTFDKLPYMKHDGYFPEAIVQYNMERKHFRCLKIYGKSKMRIYDGEEVKLIENEDKKREVMHDKNWRNYVVLYKNYDKKTITKDKYVGAWRFDPAGMENIVLGGLMETKEIKIMQWNVQSTKYWDTITNYIK